MTDTPLGQKAVDAKTLLLNLTLIFRQFRRGEFAFTPEGMQFFEDGLIALGFDQTSFLDALLAELKTADATIVRLKAQLETDTAMLMKVAGVLRRLAERSVERIDAEDLIAIGEIVETAKQRAPAEAVYLPDEFKVQGYLGDMAVPADGKVVLFPGVRRERSDKGGAS